MFFLVALIHVSAIFPAAKTIQFASTYPGGLPSDIIWVLDIPGKLLAR
jgi:hypothetical protein